MWNSAFKGANAIRYGYWYGPGCGAEVWMPNGSERKQPTYLVNDSTNPCWSHNGSKNLFTLRADSIMVSFIPAPPRPNMCVQSSLTPSAHKHVESILGHQTLLNTRRCIYPQKTQDPQNGCAAFTVTSKICPHDIKILTCWR